MTAGELLPALRAWHERMKAAEDVMDRLGAIVGTQPESPLFEAVFDMAGAYTTAIGTQLGDIEGWLEWFWLEGKLGDRPLMAEVSGVEFSVGCIEDLARVIAMDVPHNDQGEPE